ncbi:MAG: fumarylacetoacetase [Gemmataceae bacterium]
MNRTCDPSLRSWVSGADASSFPIQNLPMGAYEHPGGKVHLGVAIGDHVLDLTLLEQDGLLRLAPASEALFQDGSLNQWLSRGKAIWSSGRIAIQKLLHRDDSTLRDDEQRRRRYLLRQGDVRMVLPARIGDYTDFYSSREHASNVGSMLRGPENALMPNWLHLPVAYHGRASSVVVSGTNIIRPCGQFKPETSPLPQFGPTRSLDYELEMAALVGPGNPMGEAIPIDHAEDHLFGLTLLNDWSARDIQGWEYQPLGPFLGKNFATSVSPWVVSLEALEPFRCAGPTQDPAPLPYLHQSGKATFDIRLEVTIRSARMAEPLVVSRSNFKDLYWSLRQQVAHHTVNGCPLRPGDLLASGTISGPTPESLGCLLERTWRGSRPLSLPEGETRRFLEDGDTVTFNAWCEGPGYRLGFGSVTGTILPARN